MAKRGPKPKRLPARLIARYVRGELTAQEVARLAGMHADTALLRLREAGADTSRAARTRARWERDAALRHRREQAAALYRQGLSLPEVARQLGMTAEGVRRMLKRAGVPRRQRGGRQADAADG